MVKIENNKRTGLAGLATRYASDESLAESSQVTHGRPRPVSDRCLVFSPPGSCRGHFRRKRGRPLQSITLAQKHARNAMRTFTNIGRRLRPEGSDLDENLLPVEGIGCQPTDEDEP